MRESLRLHRPLRLSAILLVLLLPVAACGDDDDDAATGDTTASTSSGTDDGYGGNTQSTGKAIGGGSTVTINGLSYDDVSAAAGETITIKNETTTAHTFTATDGAFDSGQVAGGSSGEVTAPAESGDFEFFCQIHPDVMRATLTVT